MSLITNNNYNIAVTPWNASRSLLKGVAKIALVEGPVTTTWNAKTGGQSKVTYKGQYNQVAAIARNAQQDGFEYTIQGGKVWSIEITFPLDLVANDWNNEPNPVTSWELTNTSVEQNILELKDRALIAPLSKDTKKQIEQNMKNPISVEASIVNGASVSETINATIVQNLKFIGVEGKLQFVPTLKRTIIVSNKLPLNSGNLPKWTNTNTNGKVITKDQLVNLYGTTAANDNNPLSALPDFLAFILPSSLPVFSKTASALQTGFVDTAFIGNDGIVTFVGWLEYPPEYTTVSVTKVSISQTWVFNRWSAGAFGLYDTFPYAPGPNPTQAIITGAAT